MPGRRGERSRRRREPWTNCTSERDPAENQTLFHVLAAEFWFPRKPDQGLPAADVHEGRAEGERVRLPAGEATGLRHQLQEAIAGGKGRGGAGEVLVRGAVAG